MSSLSYFIPNNAFKLFSRLNDDDRIDKLCRKYSAIMMIVTAFLLSPFKFITLGITCWCPNEIVIRQCQLVKDLCYISEKYVATYNSSSNLPSIKTVLSHKINYYQWIIYIFLTTAALCYLPCLIWYVYIC